MNLEEVMASIGNLPARITANLLGSSRPPPWRRTPGLNLEPNTDKTPRANELSKLKNRRTDGSNETAPAQPAASPSYVSVALAARDLPAPENTRRKKNSAPRNKPEEDNHAFIWLSPTSSQHIYGATTAKAAILTRLGVLPTEIDTVKPVRSGFSVLVNTKENANTVLEKLKKAGSVFSGCLVDIATKWYSATSNLEGKKAAPETEGGHAHPETPVENLSPSSESACDEPGIQKEDSGTSATTKRGKVPAEVPEWAQHLMPHLAERADKAD
ncbi:hypothetical protein BROUX41_002696 [Berkeleyomyces rouxiae]